MVRVTYPYWSVGGKDYCYLIDAGKNYCWSDGGKDDCYGSPGCNHYRYWLVADKEWSVGGKGLSDHSVGGKTYSYWSVDIVKITFLIC